MAHSDYPDWTSLVHLVGTDIILTVEVAAQTVDLDVNFIGSDIMVPVDVQGSYIMLPVDIQAQYVDLDINIKSQSADVDVNLAASDIILNINIANQTIDISVNIKGQLVTLDVNIESSDITLNVNIASSAITLNVNLTSQSVNINIDIEAQSVGVYLQPDWQAKQGNDKDFYGSAINQASLSYAEVAYTVTTGKTLYITQAGMLLRGSAAGDRELNQICGLEIRDNTDGVYKAAIGGNGGVALMLPKPIAFASAHQLHFRGINFSNHNCHCFVSAQGFEI